MSYFTYVFKLHKGDIKMFKTTIVAVLAALSLVACGQKPAEEAAPVVAAPEAAPAEVAPAADAAAPVTAETAPVNAQ